jgi:hypothetical protein
VAELTELVDIDPERVDLVKNPANGFPILVMKAVDGQGRVNEKPDIAGAEKILQQLAVLLQAEAAELAAGNPEEICDIELLTEVHRLMSCFKQREQWNADMIANGDATKETGPLSDNTEKDAEVADDVKNEDKTSETRESQVEPVVEKSAAELLDEAVAKAVQPLQEVIKGLEDQMAVLKSTPIPGGPVVTVPAVQRNDSARANSLAEAVRHERLAKSVTDRELVRYHEEKAAEYRQAANG